MLGVTDREKARGITKSREFNRLKPFSVMFLREMNREMTSAITRMCQCDPQLAYSDTILRAMDHQE